MQLSQKSQEQVRWEDEDKRLRAEKEKRLKQLAEELRKTEKAEEEVVRQETGVIHEEITRQRIEMETKKAELRRSQAKELEGSGADMSVITSYEKRTGITSVFAPIIYAICLCPRIIIRSMTVHRKMS